MQCLKKILLPVKGVNSNPLFLSQHRVERNFPLKTPPVKGCLFDFQWHLRPAHKGPVHVQLPPGKWKSGVSQTPESLRLWQWLAASGGRRYVFVLPLQDQRSSRNLMSAGSLSSAHWRAQLPARTCHRPLAPWKVPQDSNAMVQVSMPYLHFR